MLYYLCFAPSTAIGPRLQWGVGLGGSYLALFRIHTQVRVLNRLVPNHQKSSTARLWCYSVSNTSKTCAKQKRDRGRDSQPRPRPRLNAQPQGATKHPSYPLAIKDTLGDLRFRPRAPFTGVSRALTESGPESCRNP